jgi:hypothetical protein
VSLPSPILLPTCHSQYVLSTNIPPGTTVGSIRNRISQLRVKQRDLYEQLNWELPEGGAGHSAKKTTKKRGIDDVNGAAGQKTPTKSPRKRMRKTKSEEVVDKSSEGEGEEEMEQDMGMGMVIKEEVEDEL